MTKMDRRSFFNIGGKMLAGGVLAGTIAKFFPYTMSQAAAQSTNVPTNAKWGFVVDTHKCIGCGRCVNACKTENHVPIDKEVYRTWVERYSVDSNKNVKIDSPQGGINGFPEVENRDSVTKSFFVPKLCNQCDNAPCTKVCPVGATYTTPDGVVLVDRERCVGCSYCIQACPYAARFKHPKLKVVDKCTWCYHRISKGMTTACVQACPVGARTFGEVDVPDSPIDRILEEERVNILKPDSGTKPKVYYLGLDKVVV